MTQFARGAIFNIMETKNIFNNALNNMQGPDGCFRKQRENHCFLSTQIVQWFIVKLQDTICESLFRQKCHFMSVTYIQNKGECVSQVQKVWFSLCLVPTGSCAVCLINEWHLVVGEGGSKEPQCNPLVSFFFFFKAQNTMHISSPVCLTQSWNAILNIPKIWISF